MIRLTVSITMLLWLFGTAAYCASPDDIHGWEERKDLTKLVNALDDGDAVVRERASLALGRIGDSRAIDPLIPVLGDKRPQVREAAAWALEHLGEPLGALIHQGLNGSREAMEGLSKKKDPRTIAPLLKALDSGDENLRDAAAWNLWAVGDPETLDPLIDALRDPAANVRIAAAWALEKIGTPRVVDPLLAALRDSDHRVREAAAWGLGKAGDQKAAEPLIEALGDRHSKVREAAAGALKNLKEPLGEAIVQSLSGSEKAVEELARRKDRRAIVPLVRALEGYEPSLGVAAAWALGSIGDPEAVDPLVRALKAVYPEIRLAAADALGEIGDRSAVDPLIGVLRELDGRVRIAASLALGKIGDRRAVGTLMEVLGDSNEDVREAAALALEELGEPFGRRIQEALKGSPASRGASYWRNDARSIPFLVRFLESGGGDLRRDAAVALSSTDDPRALSGLIDMAGGWNPRDRCLAMSLIADMRHRTESPDLFPVVLRILIRPASLAYLVILFALPGFMIYRYIRRRGERLAPR